MGGWENEMAVMSPAQVAAKYAMGPHAGILTTTALTSMVWCECGWTSPPETTVAAAMRHFKVHITFEVGAYAVKDAAAAVVDKWLVANPVDVETFGSIDNTKANKAASPSTVEWAEDEHDVLADVKAAAAAMKSLAAGKGVTYQVSHEGSTSTWLGKDPKFVIMDEMAYVEDDFSSFGTLKAKDVHFGALYGAAAAAKQPQPLHTVTKKVTFEWGYWLDHAPPANTKDWLALGVAQHDIPGTAWVEQVVKNYLGSTQVTYAWAEPNMGGIEAGP